MLAATAYLAVRLADEYHGDSLTGYEVLERAGYLAKEKSGSSAQDVTPSENGKSRSAVLSLNTLNASLLPWKSSDEAFTRSESPDIISGDSALETGKSVPLSCQNPESSET